MLKNMFFKETIRIRWHDFDLVSIEVACIKDNLKKMVMVSI